MSLGARPRSEEPCSSYFGNLCTGFGGTTTCLMCGWDQHDHPEEQAEIARIFDDLLGPADNGHAETPGSARDDGRAIAPASSIENGRSEL